ncbi:MAG: phospholipase D-like domain-containing protein [Thermomicrobiales bacterium]
MADWQTLRPGHSDLAVHFLAQGDQRPEDVAGWLATFIGQARRSLDLALYDARLSGPLRTILADALRVRAEAGVAIRLVYDADKPEPPDLYRGTDPAPAGTGSFIQALGYPFRRVGGPKLMHHKYIVRDAGEANAAVWTGSTNWTDDAWSLQENNIVVIGSPEIAAAYARDFADLWRERENDGTGEFDVPPVALHYAGEPLTVQLYFSPGRGLVIDEAVAARVANAQRRVRICSMLLNSGTLLNALLYQLDAGRVPVDGVYDATQMEGVLEQWETVPGNPLEDRRSPRNRRAGAPGGQAIASLRPDTPRLHAQQILVVDDTVITGSFNFSRSAQVNAENLLILDNALGEYSAYISRLVARCRWDNVGAGDYCRGRIMPPLGSPALAARPTPASRRAAQYPAGRYPSALSSVCRSTRSSTRSISHASGMPAAA